MHWRTKMPGVVLGKKINSSTLEYSRNRCFIFCLIIQGFQAENNQKIVLHVNTIIDVSNKLA